VTSQNAADISIYFDVGGIIGAIVAGLAADYTGMSASVCSVMLIMSLPMVT
jgi:OPA family glycerol-3-phosphate transporter-like MFS transporter 1/2